MISLMYPKESEDRYLLFKNILFGPFDSTNIFSGDWISFDSSLEAMKESHGIYHENNVEHDKFSGDLEYHPLLGGGQPTPTSVYPRKAKFPVLNYLGKSAWVEPNFGLALSGGCTYGRLPDAIYTTNQPLQYAMQRTPGTMLWSFVEVQAAPGSLSSVNSCTFTTIKSIAPYSGDMVKISYTVRYYQLGVRGQTTGKDWSKPQSFDTIWNLCFDTPTYTSSDLTGYAYIYKANPGYKLPPQTVKQKIDALVASIFPDQLPVTEKHYGELAHEASQQVIRNQTNMIAFLKDLRHPTEMIPKLKNLKNIKGLSNNYLSVKYGALPTVSDLDNIVQSFRNIGPYVDRNGFDTYTAGYRDHVEKDGLTFDLTQRIKLAIGEEDNEFEALLTRLESMGFLPTFENLWDLTKYSFVVDWFIDVGGFLERVDTCLRLSRLNIEYVTMSRKTEVHGTVTGDSTNPFNGTVNWVHYHRWVSDQCPVPPLSLQTNNQGFDHWLEAGALILQRL